jgi:hypothetical protein
MFQPCDLDFRPQRYGKQPFCGNAFRTFANMTWQVVLGLTIPSIVVLVAIYIMFKQYFAHQMQTYMLRSKKTREQVTLPLKLQAYERLLLLTERIELADLILRLKSPGSSATELKAALIMGIQQEFEHNLTQQLYVSDELWQIILFAKNKTMDLISQAAVTAGSGKTGEEFIQVLFELASQENQLPSHIARKAIKTESSLYL